MNVSSRCPRSEVTFSVHSSDAFGSPHIPDANGFVSRRCDEEVRVTWVPTQLVHTVAMAAVIVFFDLKEQTPGVTSLTSRVTP